MSAVYLSARKSRDGLAVVYYSVVLTGITVLVAIVIGTLQVLSLIKDIWELEGGFWDGVEKVGEVYEFVGLGIVGMFIVIGGGGVLVYPRWRRWIEVKRREYAADGLGVEDGGRTDEDEERLLRRRSGSESEGEDAGEEDRLMGGRRE